MVNNEYVSDYENWSLINDFNKHFRKKKKHADVYTQETLVLSHSVHVFINEGPAHIMKCLCGQTLCCRILQKLRTFAWKLREFDPDLQSLRYSVSSDPLLLSNTRDTLMALWLRKYPVVSKCRFCGFAFMLRPNVSFYDS